MVRGKGRGNVCIKVNNIKVKQAVAYNYDIAPVCFYIALNWPKIYFTIYPETHYARQ